MTTTREAALHGLLDAAVAGRVSSWSPPPGDAEWARGLELWASVLTQRWRAPLPPPPAGDPEAGWLQYAAALWSASGDPGRDSGALLARLGESALPDPGTPLGRFAGYLLVEATMAHARLDLAASIADRLGPRVWASVGHPFGAAVAVCRARLLAFRGDIAAAGAVVAGIPPPTEPLLAALVAATSALVRGNDADATEVRRLVATVDAIGAPEGHLAVGAHLLAAYGEVALQDTSAAARRVLLAGGDEQLSRLNVVDRALALEALVSFAVAHGDLDAAETWADQIAPLLASPIADSTAARALSRVALLAGRADEAVAWGERALARAGEVDRVIEHAEAEIVLNRARLEHPGHSSADAVRALRAMVAAAEERGHGMARRAAARELRAAGLRLPPLAGSGWAGLSEREADVARLVAAGLSNHAVAQALHVSDHTVRAHLSRVLAAFGVATRSALPAAVRAGPPGPARLARDRLTSRQRDVAALVADGLRNAEIAARLALSERTVERHVSDVLGRAGLPNRVALARAWLAG
ncbi:hypothetical protein G5V58_23350 [Nocardioides anomalus]|uniref:HTH luxR-type domain-containing protein n=1 Tax=Nocardioides anomalus TaxID=2712223 RepID=A0A6G6WJ73_9ACTN|nr:LuxR family transcriptional regulator [Nocardioides anomalus]QIG45294.1 hypothetical protein G5V58_23350 [Nocardioides anomalus]